MLKDDIEMNLKAVQEEYGVNEEQARSLNIDMNIALRAGAGSGKTRVLTKRFIRMFIENKDLTLDQVVAITFTKKAATEMKDRIRKELNGWIIRTTAPEEKRRLEDLKLQLTNAFIDTIHSFCGRLIKEYYIELGIDPMFKIIEEVDKKVALLSIADRVIEDWISDPYNKEALDAILESTGVGFLESTFKSGVLELVDEMRSKGYIFGAIKEVTLLHLDEKDDRARQIVTLCLEMVEEIISRYEQYKDEENLLDFNDLELTALKMLDNNQTRQAIQTQFKVFMIDEFQDVNPLQKKIMDRLVYVDGGIPSGRLFIVGDHKQSIYGFRGSDYKVFEQACEEIMSNGCVEFLHNCYRSTNTIINGVNKIFSKLLKPYEPLKYPDLKKSIKENKIELITWNKEDILEVKAITRWEASKGFLGDEKDVDNLKEALYRRYKEQIKINKKDIQGKIVAGAIHSLIQRGYQYQDIAILLRSRTSLQEIESALITNKIPYCVLGGIGFWDRFEIKDILGLYKLIFYSGDHLTLFSVLRSPIFGFTDDLLVAFAKFIVETQDQSIDELMKTFLCEADEASYPLIERAAYCFETLLPLDGILNAVDLFKAILELTDYENILLALPEGEKKYRNLEKLIQLVEEFERKGIYRACDLVSYMEEMKNASAFDNEASLDTEDSDAVKLLTIHASKGLEFKCVLIPDMDTSVDAMAKKHKPLFFVDEKIGIITEAEEPDEDDLYNMYDDAKLKRELEDSRRIFYVAATRAEEYLGFIGQYQGDKIEDAIEEQNSFMRQLLWSIGDGIEEIQNIHGTSIMSKLRYQPNETQDFTDILKALKVTEGESELKLKPYYSLAEGNLNISAWLKYKDCPRYYYLTQLIGLKAEEVFTKEENEFSNDEDVLRKREDELREGEEVFGKKEDEFGKYEDVVATIKDEALSLYAGQLGTAFHSILEKADLLHYSKEAFNQYFDEKTKDNKFYIQNQVFFEKAKEGFHAIQAKRASVNKGKLVALYPEFGYRVALKEGLYLNGFIDCLEVYEDQGDYYAVIVDYKTNYIENVDKLYEKAAYYEEQLLSYAWAIEQIPFYNGKHIKVKESLIYFLTSGELVTIEITKEKMDEVVEKLKASSPWLLGEKAFEDYRPSSGEICKWCEVKGLCEE